MHPCRSVQRIRCLQARKARSSRSVLDRTSRDTGKRLAYRLWATVTGDRCSPAGSGATAGHHVCLPVPLRRRRPDARLSSSRPGCTRPQQCQQSTSSHSCFHSCASAARSPLCGHTSNAVCTTVASRHFFATSRPRLLKHLYQTPHCLCRIAVFSMKPTLPPAYLVPYKPTFSLRESPPPFHLPVTYAVSGHEYYSFHADPLLRKYHYSPSPLK